MTVALSIVFALAAAALLILTVGEVRKTQGELEEAETLLLAVLLHDIQVSSASFHPDGKHVVTASADGRVRIWDWEANHVVAILPEAGPVWSAAFSPDGRVVVTAAENHAVIWDWRSKKRVTTLQHDAPVTRAEFDPDGRLVVTAAGQEARVWDWRAARVVAVLPHQTDVSSAAFGSGRVVTGSADRARVWDVRSMPPRLLRVLPRRFRGSSAVQIFDADFGPGGIVIVATPGAATIYKRGMIQRELIHAGNVTSAAISPDGGRVLTTSSAGAALLWSRNSKASPVVLRRDDASDLMDAGFSPDGKLVVTASSDGRAEVYRPAQPARGGD